MKSNDKILNIIIYVIIGLMVIVGIIFFIPESKEEKPSDNNDKKDEIVITFTTTDTNITLKKGETKKINYSLSGDYNINWFSSNNSVVQVQNAEIKAINSGTANITGTVSVDGVVKSITIKVTVEKDENETPTPTPTPEPTKPQIEKLVIASNKISVVVDETKKIEYRIEPTDGEIKSLKWTSDDTSIATVDENGNVKGIKEGSTIVTININNTLIGKITIKVKPKIKGLNLKSSSSITLKIGDTSQISAETNPTNSNVKITYKSDNSNVTVSDKGLIKAVSGGTSIVTVSADKYSKKVTVTVRPKTGVVNGDGVWGYTDSKTVNPVRAGVDFFTSLANKGIGSISGNIYKYSNYTYDISKSILTANGRNSYVRIYYPAGVDLSDVNTFTFFGGSGDRNWGSFFDAIDKNTSLIKSSGIIILVSAYSSYHQQDGINGTEFVKAIVKQKSGKKNTVAGYSMGGPASGEAMLYGNYDRLIVVCSYVYTNTIKQLKDKEIYFFSPVGDTMLSTTKETLNTIKSQGDFKDVSIITNNTDLINTYSNSMLIINPGGNLGTGHTWYNITDANLFAFACKD